MGLLSSNPTGFPTYRKYTGLKTIFFIICLVFALYLINYQFKFFVAPESVLKYENWILFVGGVLLLIGAFNFIKPNKNAF